MKLILADKAYSSWSFRPWLLMRHLGLAFEEEIIRLDQPDTQARIRRYGLPTTVPILVDGEATLWETTAIIEHLAERFRDKPVWPKYPTARALARAMVGEMHAGFRPLRQRCPMNFHRAPKAIALADDVKADVARVVSLWEAARHRHGGDGPFLFGEFSAADAMFAPVVNRFHVYEVPVSGTARTYMDRMMGLAAWKEWAAAAAAETWRIEKYESVA